MKKFLVLALAAIAGSASAQVFDVPVQPPEMRPGYGLEGKGLHLAVPTGQPGLDCVINPVSMRRSVQEQTTETVVETKTLVAGQIFSIPANVLFNFDKAFVRPEGLEELLSLYMVLVEGEALEIKVVGHTDSMGTDAYNLDLGLRRAQAVAAVLVDYGFTADAIVIESAGESQPKVSNTAADGSDDPAGRQINRRVDLEVVRVADKEITTTEVVTTTEQIFVEKNPQIFHRLGSNFSVPCGDQGVPPGVAVGVGGNVGLFNRGIVITTVPR